MRTSTQNPFKMGRIIHTSTNYNQLDLFSESNNEPSLTVPDQTLTLRQLLLNHTRGHDLPPERNAVYNEDFDIPDPRKLDLTDLENNRASLSEKKSSIESDLRQLKKMALEREKKAKEPSGD